MKQPRKLSGLFLLGGVNPTRKFTGLRWGFNDTVSINRPCSGARRGERTNRPRVAARVLTRKPEGCKRHVFYG